MGSIDIPALRSHFPVTKQWAFLDHAAVCAPSAACAAAMAEWATDLASNGIASFQKWHDRLKAVRLLAGQLLNADTKDVCFVGNTTQGVNIVAEGFPWRAGDNVVTAAEEYPTNQYPWMNQRDRGVDVRAVPSVGPRVRAADLMAACDSHTRVLTISSVEFASGFRNDLIALGDFCRQRGIFFFVDGIQSLGVIPMDVQNLPVDAVAADSHKWLLGPEGAGITYIRREWVERLHPIGVGWNSVVHAGDFSRVEWNPHPHAGRYEGGTQNYGGILGMGESMRLLLGLGIEAVEARIAELTDHLAERVRQKGHAVFSSMEPGERSGIVSVDTPGHDPHAIMRRCREAGVIVNVRGGRLRVSPHVYNTPEDLDRFADVLPQSHS
ncbi:aminotransferase class V-fold PLP-dependent enzyme [Zavarzinella formosa]|uniref:aminotransferase class V-fold PLP-dependent enzyme n=1 Tax=Zavarzinella formosa TaxID=360055 RepID=UPI0002E74344|nr:aminotransferase class V-fold PLP-dependent enzyme [Zavarzinella formosa]